MNSQINFLTVLFTVFALIIMLVPGFIFGKFKLLPEKAAESFSKIVLYCCQSALVFAAFVSKTYTPEIGINILIVFVLAIVVHMLMIALVSIIFRKENEKQCIIKYGSVFSNCGFMGIPFLQMLFSGHGSVDEILIYAAVVIAAFNIVNWTFGVILMTNDKSKVSIKKILLNPVIISIVLGFIVFVILKKPLYEIGAEGTSLREFFKKIYSSIDSFGNIVTPLSMFTIGLKLADVNFKQLFLDKSAYIVSFMKLIIMPLLSIFIVAFLPISTEVKYTIFLLLAMPCATSTSLFAVLFNKDANFSSVCVLLSTILSVVTLPIMFLVMSQIFKVII